MGPDEGSPSFLESAKEKYEELMLGLEEKGVPSPRTLVPALLVLALLAVAYFSLTAVASPKKDLQLQVKNAGGNGIASMEVRLYSGESLLGMERTDGNGIAKFRNVPANAQLQVKVSDPNEVYAEKQQSISFSTPEITLTQAQGEAEQPAIFVVRVTDSALRYVPNAAVALQFDGGSRMDALSDAMGEAAFALSAIPDHLTIKTAASGYVANERSLLKSEILLGNVLVRLESEAEERNQLKEDAQAEEQRFGKILLSLESAGSGQLEGIQAVLKDAISFRALKTARSDASGSILFEGVLLGREYAIEVKESARYLGANSEEFTLSSSGDQLELRVQLQEKLQGDFIDLHVLSDGVAVSGAELYLFGLEGRQLQRGFTNADGKLTFLVSKQKEYYVTAYASGYLPSSLKTFTSTSVQRLELEKRTEENSAELKVSVLEKGEPSENAAVALFKENGEFLGIPPEYSDMEGTVSVFIPRELEGAAYDLFARAVKESGTGESARISSRAAEELLINLVGAPAKLEVQALDALRRLPLRAGTVSARDPDGNELQNCQISEGKCTLASLPSETEITITAISAGFLQTASEPIVLSPSELRRVQLHLVSEAASQGVSTSFLGFFNSQGEVKELGNAESYDAKFLVSFQTAGEYQGFHLHLSSPGNFVEIQGIDAGAQSLFTSAKFSQENCYSAADNGTIGSLDVLFPKGMAGSREIAVKIAAKPEAPAGSSFALNYKAYWEKDGVILSSPSESELKIGEPVTGLKLVQKMCQQKNSVRQVQITDSPLLCNGDASFCRKISFEGGKRAFDPVLGQEFSLNFEVLSQEPIDGIALKNPNLKLLGANAGTNLAGEGLMLADDEGAQIASISIPAGVKTPGSLKLKALRAGTSVLRISFNSEKQAFKHQQNLKISGENAMQVAAAPLKLVVGEEKRIRISAEDQQGKPITDALLTLYDCERAPLDAEELQLQGSDERNAGEGGLYSFLLAPRSTGKIGVRIEHPEFRKYGECAILVEADENSLGISPASLQFKGDSSLQAEQTVTVSSSLGIKSALSLISNCGNHETPVLYALPNYISNFRDSTTIQIGVIANVSATTSCVLTFEQRLSQDERITRAIPVRIDVQAPSASDIGDPQLPLLAPTILLELDVNGFADSFFSTANVGEVSFCDVKAAENFRVDAECTKKMVHLSADYSALKLTRDFRQAGKLQVRAADQLLRSYSIIVSAPDAPEDAAATDYVYYSNLPALPNPIVIQLDPYTRRHDFSYSLGNFGEPVVGVNLRNLDYGLSLEYNGPYEQRVRVVADFSGADVYNRILQRIYGANPACLNYYSQFGLQGYGNANYPSQYQYGQYPIYGASYQYQNGYAYGPRSSGSAASNQYPYSQPYNGFADYSSLNQYGNGAYALPQYVNGQLNYGNYPDYNSQYPGQYYYPQPAYSYGNLQGNIYLSGGIGNPYIDPRFSTDACSSAYIEGSLLLRLQSGRQQAVPVRIVAKGSAIPPQRPVIYGPRNGILSPQDVVLDPYTNSRFVSYELRFWEGARMQEEPQFDVAGDPDYYSQLRLTANYRAQQQLPGNFNPLLEPSEGRFANAIKALKGSLKEGGLAVSFDADASSLSLAGKEPGGALNKEEELYLRLFYPSQAVVQLSPILLKIGGGEFNLEPLSQNMQFIIGEKKNRISQKFKLVSDIFSEQQCEITGWADAFAETGYLGEQQALVQLQAEFESGKFELEGEGEFREEEHGGDGGENGDHATVSIPDVHDSPADLNCKTQKGSFSARLHVAAFPRETPLNLEKSSEGKISPIEKHIPFVGQIASPDSASGIFTKSYSCETKSARFSAKLQAMEDGGKESPFSCEFSSEGLALKADYQKLLEALPESERLPLMEAGIDDALTLSISSLTEYPKSRLKEKTTRRRLGDVVVRVAFKAPEEEIEPIHEKLPEEAAGADAVKIIPPTDACASFLKDSQDRIFVLLKDAGGKLEIQEVCMLAGQLRTKDDPYEIRVKAPESYKPSAGEGEITLEALFSDINSRKVGSMGGKVSISAAQAAEGAKAFVFPIPASRGDYLFSASVGGSVAEGKFIGVLEDSFWKVKSCTVSAKYLHYYGAALKVPWIVSFTATVPPPPATDLQEGFDYNIGTYCVGPTGTVRRGKGIVIVDSELSGSQELKVAESGVGLPDPDDCSVWVSLTRNRETYPSDYGGLVHCDGSPYYKPKID